MLTNKLNLPEPFVRFANRKRYSKGDARYSVTEIIKPARMGALERLYGEAIVEDVADYGHALFGSAVHMVLEVSGAPETGALLEERLFMDVNGVRISGGMDHCLLYPTGVLDDYKTSSVWAVMHGLKWEWEAQTNLYRLLQHTNGRVVTELRIIAWLKDWSLGKARTVAGYPEKDVVVLDVPVWDIERAQRYAEERVAAHALADLWVANTGALQWPEPFCTDEERWTRPRVWRVIKENQKRAIPGGVCDSETEANYKAQAIPGARVEEGGGEPIRCIDYCTVGRAGFCTQWEGEKARLGKRAEVDTSAFD